MTIMKFSSDLALFILFSLLHQPQQVFSQQITLEAQLYSIYDTETNDCLSAEGTTAFFKPCNPNDNKQTWQRSTSNHWVNIAEYKCLSLPLSGTAVYMTDCQVNNPTLAFPGTSFTNPESNQCLSPCSSTSDAACFLPTSEVPGCDGTTNELVSAKTPQIPATFEKFYITGQDGTNCLSVLDQTNVLFYMPCNETDLNQQWSQGSTGTIINSKTSNCIDINGNVVTQPCSTTSSSQIFSSYSFGSPAFGACLSSCSENPSLVCLYTSKDNTWCDVSRNQRGIFEALSSDEANAIDNDDKDDGLSAGAIVGIVIGCLLLGALLAAAIIAFFVRRHYTKKDKVDKNKDFVSDQPPETGTAGTPGAVTEP
eukprot:Awhi_evm1s14838